MLIPFQWVVAFCRWNATSRRADCVHSFSSVQSFTSVSPVGNTPVSYLLSLLPMCFSTPQCLFYPLMKLLVTSQRPCMFGKKGFSGKLGRFLKSLLPSRWKLPLSSLTGKCRGAITTQCSLLAAAPAHLGFTVSRNLCCSFCPFPLPLPSPPLFLDGSVITHF